MQRDAVLTPKENYLRAIRRQSPVWVPMENDRSILKSLWMPIVERPTAAGKDVFGVEWAYNADAEGGTYPSEKNLVLTDITRWREQVVFPTVDDVDWERARDWADSIDRESYLIEGRSEMGLFERTYLLMVMENALMAYYTDPEEMYELCGAIADYKIAVIGRFIEVIRPDMIWYGDDWGTQSNLFISPDLWRTIIKPHTKRIYDSIRARGVMVKQHSCGKIESVFGDLCEMGADMYNPCQPCNDLKGLKERYGDRICFCGGIDSQFVLSNPAATPEDVCVEVRRRMDELAGSCGGYLAGPSHTVPYDPAKLEAMRETIRTYGRAVYER